jgi:sugar lactone lactonase YvrE
VIATVAGGGASLGDNGPATSAQLALPDGIAVDSGGNLYVADWGNNRIRKVSNGVITTVAGTGTRGFGGDNGLATGAQLANPQGVAVDSAGNLYIADFGNASIRKVSNGIITTVAGNGTPGFSGDNGPATSAQLYLPYGVAVDSAGNLYIGDSGNNRVRKVSNGAISTVAGNGTFGFSGDHGPPTSAQLANPYGVAIDSAGNLYIGDSGNSRIRVSAPLPIIKSVVNAASYATGPVSPGEMITIFGTALGPVTAAYATMDPATGKLATNIGGVQVLFNGTPASMIYAASGQVSAVVPYEMAPTPNPSVWIQYLG